MANLLIISFDQLTRNESNAFRLLEKALELAQSKYQDMGVDYYDLLQEDISDQDRSRFLAAEKVFIVFSSPDKEKIPELFFKKWEKLAQTGLLSCLQGKQISMILATIYSYLTDLKKVEALLKQEVTLITHDGDLHMTCFH